MRTHIWKALRARSVAIKNSLKRYNELAATMDPPAPTLEWKNVVTYSFVAEFDLLRHHYSIADISNVKWSIPAHREVANKFHKIKRAKEEIVRLNVEVNRLRTSIHDEDRLYLSRIDLLGSVNPLLVAELKQVYRARRRVNLQHLARITQIESLPGYSGTFMRGAREGGIFTFTSESSFDNIETTSMTSHGDTAEDQDGDDDMDNVMNSLGEFMENLQ
jgi:hypothetical protein